MVQSIGFEGDLRCVMLSVLAYGSIDSFLSASLGSGGTGGAFSLPLP